MNIEPFGYFRVEPFGWTDCDKDDEGAMPLFDGAVIMDLQSQLATERASLFAESQRKQQLEGQRDELLAVLERMVAIHDEPSGFAGKYGKALDAAIDAQAVKIDSALESARAAIQKVRGGE